MTDAQWKQLILEMTNLTEDELKELVQDRSYQEVLEELIERVLH